MLVTYSSWTALILPFLMALALVIIGIVIVYTGSVGLGMAWSP